LDISMFLFLWPHLIFQGAKVTPIRSLIFILMFDPLGEGELHVAQPPP
jgi:hypothetical protein